MRVGVSGFQSDRLLQARLSRGLTQTALAVMVGRSSGTVSKWENGEQVPETEALENLASRLAMPVSWFLKPVPDYGKNVCFFRSTASVTKEAQNIALIRLKWLNEISLTMQQWLDWPDVNVPNLDNADHRTISDAEIEDAAIECRQRWGLGLGPISDMLLVLENAGIICVREELGFSKMDGASRWFSTDGLPYVFLASDKANGVRSRFDAAHELGHLVLHRNVTDLEFSKRYPELERQAHLFAGAFLLPAESFAAEVTKPSLDTFLALKMRWRVSIGAMIMRCRRLNIFDEEYATRLWKNYSARGWRRLEPRDNEIGFEPIRLLPRAVNALLNGVNLNREGLLLAMGFSAKDCQLLCSLPEGFFDKPASVSDLSELRLKSVPNSRLGLGSPHNVLPFPGRSLNTD